MLKKLIGAAAITTVTLNGVIAADYRTKMVNYVSLDRTQNPDQTIGLFAPQAALDAATAAQELPYGTVLVAEIYKAKMEKDGKVITSSLGRRIRDKFAAIAVMQKGEGWGKTMPTELRNGDWDFAIFSPQGERLVEKDLNTCRGCHTPLKQTQHLFSLEHMQ
jgi:hypothetical protein